MSKCSSLPFALIGPLEPFDVIGDMIFVETAHNVPEARPNSLHKVYLRQLRLNRYSRY